MLHNNQQADEESDLTMNEGFKQRNVFAASLYIVVLAFPLESINAVPWFWEIMS